MSVNQDKSTDDCRCVMHVCKIIILDRDERGRRVEQNRIKLMLLIFSRLVLPRRGFSLISDFNSKQSDEKHFISFFRGMKKNKAENVEKVFFFSHMRENTLLRRRSRIHG